MAHLMRLTAFILFIHFPHLKAVKSVGQESCYKVNAPECFGNGNYSCDGNCICDEHYFGRKCECATDSFYFKNEERCREPNTQIDCSGRGSCICNINCMCEERVDPSEVIFGKFCECDNYSCNRYKGKICGGHGTCDCGRCICSPPWMGEACECASTTNSCYPPHKENPSICDNHGDCVCGICQCHGTFSGRYCETCPDCPDQGCDKIEPCVLCQTAQVQDDDTCEEKCKNIDVKEKSGVELDIEGDETLCARFEIDACKYAYKYKNVNDMNYLVYVQRDWYKVID